MSYSNGEHRAIMASLSAVRDTLVDFRKETRRDLETIRSSVQQQGIKMAVMDAQAQAQKKRITGVEQVVGAGALMRVKIGAWWSAVRVVGGVFAVILPVIVTLWLTLKR